MDVSYRNAMGLLDFWQMAFGRLIVRGTAAWWSTESKWIGVSFQASACMFCERIRLRKVSCFMNITGFSYSYTLSNSAPLSVIFFSNVRRPPTRGASLQSALLASVHSRCIQSSPQYMDILGVELRTQSSRPMMPWALRIDNSALILMFSTISCFDSVHLCC